MALSRAQVITTATGELEDVLALAQLTAVDDASNMKPAIDRVFRAFGVVESGLSGAAVADGSETAALAYARYFILDRALLALANKMDVAGSKGGAKLNQQYTNVREQMERALRIAQAYGLAVPGAGRIGGVPLPSLSVTKNQAGYPSTVVAPLTDEGVEPLFQRS